MGLNEPADQSQPHCHVAKLSESTLSHGMIAGADKKPSYGMTIGVEDILASRRVLMLVVGAGKENATQQLLSGEITNQFPATHLWRHENVDCLVVTQSPSSSS
jgi:galactosamine-6-phosphate isomerase